MGSIVVDLGPDPTTGLDSYPTQANAISNSVVAARNNALLLNATALSNYMTKFNNWSQQVVAGKIDNTNPPAPPLAWETFVDTEGYSNVRVSATTPLCPMPPIPVSHVQTQPTPPPNNIDIGTCILIGTTPSAYYRVGPMDSWPIGKETPPGAQSADGAVGVFLRLGAAVGTGWYEKVG